MKTILTLGWDHPDSTLPAASFIASTNFIPDQEGVSLGNCESLFRRTPDGYVQIKQLPEKISEIKEKNSDLEVRCYFNAFAFAFLKGAKNLDLLFPEEKDSPFRKEEEQFRSTVQKIAEFEQLGKNFPASQDKDVYLKARPVLARPGTRDERRVLAELLISGPSNSKDLSEELGISPSLIDRILSVLFSANLITELDGISILNSSSLPVTYFLLRATMGLDPLSLLSE